MKDHVIHLLYLYLSAALFFAGSTYSYADTIAGAENADSIIKITSSVPDRLNFYYVNSLRGSGPINFFKDQTINIPAAHPIFLMQPDALQTPYLLYPGDDINIVKDSMGQIIFKTTNDIRNNELDFFRQLCVRYGAIRPLYNTTYITSGVTVKQRDSIIEKHYRDRLAFADSFTAAHKVSDSFREIISRCLKHSRIFEKMNLFYKGFNKKMILDYYKDSLNAYRSYFNCDSCLADPVFPDALLCFVMLQTEQESPGKQTLRFSGLSKQELEAAIAFADHNFTGRIKDFITGNAIQSQMFALAASKSLTQLDPRVADIKTEEYKKSLIEQYENTNSLVDLGSLNPGEQILFRKKSGDSIYFRDLFNADKVLLIDFWATWCTPCIGEFPYSLQLLKHYPRDKFDIVFISLDEDRAKWRQYTMEGLPMENFYLLKGNFNSPVVKKYIKDGAIPHYMLIKNGKILSSDAPRPSSPALRALIDKNL